MKRSLVWGVAGLALAPALLLSSLDPIAERQELMKNTREALKPMVGMSRGELDYDTEQVMSGLHTFLQTAQSAGELFPEGSESGGDTEARSTIWTDRDGFNERLSDFRMAVEAAIASKPQNLDEFQPVLASVTKTCKGCHDDYRIEKD